MWKPIRAHTCPKCNGKGRTEGRPCPNCHGTGYTTEDTEPHY